MLHLQFPIGKYEEPATCTPEMVKEWVEIIAHFSETLEKEVAKLSEKDLDTPYRPDGWTGRQVVHHLADSHLNAFARFKLALTEDNPMIKPYKEELWAELTDYQMPVSISLSIIKGIHQRWAIILENMTWEAYERTYSHPQYNKVFTLAAATGLYAWHCRHHLAHLQLLQQS